MNEPQCLKMGKQEIVWEQKDSENKEEERAGR